MNPTIQEKALAFAREQIAPVAKDLDQEYQFPKEIFEKLGEEGFFTLLIPKEQGGLGLGLFEHEEVVRTFAKASASVGLCYMMHNVALNTVLNAGSDDLKAEIIDAVVNKHQFLALAYSESGTGTHFYLPETKADHHDGQVTLKGRKSMVTSAQNAQFYLVLSEGEEEDVIDNWVVSKDDAGVEFIPEWWHGLGMHSNVSCPMDLKNVTLDYKYRLGEPGSGLNQVLMYVAPMFITGLAAVYTGLGEHIQDIAIAHAQDRKYPDGTMLAEIDTVKLHLSNIYSNVFASIEATKAAAQAGAQGDEDALAKIIAARIIASENVIESGRLAMRVGGGRAYNAYGDFAWLLRDTYAGQIMAPSVDVLHQWLGQAVTGQQVP